MSMTTDGERRPARDPQRLDQRDRSGPGDLEALDARRLRYIRLAQEFAALANSVESIEEGVTAALRGFCRGLGWPIGHAYLQAGSASDRYVDSALWWIEDGLDAEMFVRASAVPAFEAGMGFVGRVIESREAQWIDEDIAESMPARAEAVKRIGLRCGIAFPILVQSRVAGVLEFYSREGRRCERELLDAGAQLGIQLGRVVEREEFERALARISQEERCQLGRELHDTLSQQLTGIGMLARSLERKLCSDGNADAARARTLLESIQDARQHLRAVARGLNPVDVDAGTLGRAVSDFLEDTAKTFNIRCRFDGSAALDIDDDFTANQLFCIIREAVHNAAKHAEAGLIRIDVSAGPQRTIELRVRDDGRGFDVQAVRQSGMGLRTLHYRARLIGASLRLESAPGRGTVVVCSLKGGDE